MISQCFELIKNWTEAKIVSKCSGKTCWNKQAPRNFLTSKYKILQASQEIVICKVSTLSFLSSILARTLYNLGAILQITNEQHCQKDICSYFNIVSPQGIIIFQVKGDKVIENRARSLMCPEAIFA